MCTWSRVKMEDDVMRYVTTYQEKYEMMNNKADTRTKEEARLAFTLSLWA